MRFALKVIAILVMIGLWQRATAAPAGVVSLQVPANERSAPLHVTVWYPTSATGDGVLIGDNGVFHGTPGLPMAAVAQGRFPLVLVYPGGFRAAPNVGNWLGSALAENQFIVAVITPPAILPGLPTQSVLSELWLRPADLSVAISAVESDVHFANSINSTAVGAVGLFLGGYAVLEAVGARADASIYAKTCEGKALSIDCAWFSKGSVDLHKVNAAQLERSNLDPRITSAVVIDPELTGILTTESLMRVSVPVHVVNSGREEAISPLFDASRLANMIPKASYTVIPDAQPFNVFPECKPKGAAILNSEGSGEPLCKDVGSVTRAEIHADLVSLIVAALR